MMTGQGDDIAAYAGRRGRLRASHADREQVIEGLKAAFVQGRLTKDEFDLRVGQTLASRTYAELAAVTTEIPAGPTPALPPPEQSRPPVNNDVKWGVAVITGIIALAALLVAVAWLSGNAAVAGAVVMPVILLTAVAIYGALYGTVTTLASRHKKRPLRRGQGVARPIR